MPPRAAIPPKQEGSDYCSIVLTIEPKHGGCLNAVPVSRPTDAEGHELRSLVSRFTGLTFRDRSDMTAGYLLGKGATVTLLYVVPRRLTPVHLAVSYSRVGSKEAREAPTKGQLDVTLAKQEAEAH